MLKYLGLFIIIGLITAGLTSLIYSYVIVDEVRVYKSSVIVSDFVGIDASRDSLRFGAVTPGGTSKRNITISNTRTYGLRTNIMATGNLSPMVKFSDNYFWLEPNESRTVSLMAFVPSDAAQGTYNGTIKFYFKRV